MTTAEPTNNAATESTMPTAPEHDVDTEQVTAYVRAWRDLEMRRLAVVDEQIEVKAKIRKLLTPGDSLDVDGKPIRCTTNRRFDVDRAAALLTPEVRDLCRLDGYDPKLVKKYLPPALADGCMVEQGEPRVTLA